MGLFDVAKAPFDAPGWRANRVQSIAVVTAVVAVFSVAAFGQSPSPATFVPLSASIVRVEANRQYGGLSLGSGVTVAPAVVVTNCHVTRDAATIRISGSGRTWGVDAQYADTAHDLCFLRAPAWRGSPVVLGGSDALRSGQQVAALGFTGGTAIALKLGSIRALHALEDNRIIESDAAFSSGSSGGGLFDANGVLIGLLTFRLRGSGANYYSLPVQWIRDRLPAEDQWTSVQPLQGALPFWQGDAETLPYFMRVAPLDAEGRWAELLDLANHWSSSHPRDTEPLLVRAKALQKLNCPQAAIVAFNDALRLSPDDPAIWYGVALVYASAGDDVALHRAEARLEALDAKLAAELVAQLERLQNDRSVMSTLQWRRPDTGTVVAPASRNEP